MTKPEWTYQEWKKTVKTFNWNEQQKTVLQCGLEGTENLMISACAGAGKTTLMTGITSQLPSNRTTETGEKKDYRIKIMTFNRHLIDALNKSGKLPKGNRITASTTTATAKGILNRWVKTRDTTAEIIIDRDDKICEKYCYQVAQEFNCFHEEYETLKNEDYAELLYPVIPETIGEEEVKPIAKLVYNISSLCRKNLTQVSASNYLALKELTEHYNLEPDDYAIALNDGHYLVLSLLVLSVLNHLTVRFYTKYECHFDTMLWLIEELDLYPTPKEIIVVDEAQDSNKAHIRLYERFTQVGARLIAVADKNQAIMGFTGADTEAWETFRKTFHAKEMTLDYTFRCGQIITQLAAYFHPTIKAAPDNPKGRILTISPNEAQTLVQPKDFVLARFIAPLIGWHIWLKQEGKTSKIRGFELAEELIKYARRFEENGSFNYRLCLQGSKERVLELTAQGKDQAADKIRDYYRALHNAYYSQKAEFPELRAFSQHISTFFEQSEEETNQIILSTIHRAKGDEADTVFLLECNHLLYQQTRNQCMERQEENLVYVAITRAKKNLYLVPTERSNATKVDHAALKLPYGGLTLPKRKLI